MKPQIRALLAAIALTLVLMGTNANASQQWAVATSYTGVYLLDYTSGQLSSTIDTGLTGSSLGGVAIWNNYVFVADGSQGAGKLHIGQISSSESGPTIHWQDNAITLGTNSGGLINPSAVAVDAAGGVYVISGSRTSGADGTHSYIAYIPAQGQTWSSSALNLIDTPTAFFSDIAGGEAGKAYVAQQDSRDPSKHWAGQTWVSSVISGNVNTNLPEDNGYEPRGIASGSNGISYVVNHSTDTGNGAQPLGSISVISDASLASLVASAIGTGTFRPTDVSYFSLEGTNYLGVVGTTEGGADQAWRITLDANGKPLVTVNASGALTSDTVLTRTLGNSTDAFCTISPDGKVFWVTNPGTGKVTAIDTSTWIGMDLTLAGGPRYIAAFTPSDSAVPEPSSLLALLSGSMGLIGILRRKRR